MTIPEFGSAPPEVECVLRPGGYAVIFHEAGEVAVLSTPSGLFLPGGGQGPGEPPELAAVRESFEECGLRITLGPRIGVADEILFAVEDRRHYRKRCTFFLAAALAELGGGESDHELSWVSSAVALASLRHGSQRWAVSEACRLTSR